MSIENFNMYGGNYVANMEVHDCVINVQDDGQVSSSLKGESSAPINTAKSTPTGCMTSKPVTKEMIKIAATRALTLKDENGKRVFDRIYYWQSIYRILADENIEKQYKRFVEMVNNIFPEEYLAMIDAKDLVLKDASNISRYDDGMYGKPFSKWVKEDSLTSAVDPRYLIAEEFKKVLEGLRIAK